MDSFLLLSCVLSPYRHIVSRILMFPGWLFLLRDKQEAKFGGVDRDESCVHFNYILGVLYS